MTRSNSSAYRCVARGAQFTLVDEFGRRKIRTFFRYNASHELRSRDSFSVPRGVVVPHSFAPNNDAAQEDRKAQLLDPVKFVESEQDRQYMAELLRKEGAFKGKREALAWLDAELKEAAKKVSPVSAGISDAAYIKAISEAYQPKEMRGILDANVIPYFRGANAKILAKKVFEAGLFDEIRVKKLISM